MESSANKPVSSSELKSLYQSEQLRKYIVDTSVSPREHEQLTEIREATEKLPNGRMCLAAEEAQFINLIVKAINARNTIEIGVFTGYSLLATALALPKDGKVVAIDLSKSLFEEIGLPAFRKAGVEEKIHFTESLALPALDKMVEEDNGDGFDFAFVDADKINYLAYHERLLKLVKVGGIIAYDNTLWGGTVAKSDDDPTMPEWFNEIRRHTIKFNETLSMDFRVDISQLCMGDGLTICRRAY